MYFSAFDDKGSNYSHIPMASCFQWCSLHPACPEVCWFLFMHIVVLFFFFCRLQQHQSHKRSFQGCLLVSNVLRYPWSQQSVVTTARGFSHPVKVLKSTAFSHSRTQLQVLEQVVASCLHGTLDTHGAHPLPGFGGCSAAGGAEGDFGQGLLCPTEPWWVSGFVTARRAWAVAFVVRGVGRSVSNASYLFP